MGARNGNELRSRKGVRAAYLLLGLGCTAVAFINLAIPGLPSTVFLLVALWAFSRSNPRLELWLLNHPWFGRSLRNWQEHRAMSRRAKVAAVLAVWAGLGVSAVLAARAGLVLLALALVFLGVGLSWFLATRTTAPEHSS